MAGGQVPSDAAHVAVAKVVGVHGVRGALKCLLHDRDSVALQVGIEVRLRAATGEELLRARILRAAPKPGTAVVRLWLDGLDSRERADALREAELWIDREHLPPLEEGEFFLADTIGLSVLDGERVLGTVVGVTDNRAQDLLEVEWESTSGKTRRWLLPAIPEFITAVDDRGVHVDMPPDMLPTELERGRPNEP